MKRVLLIDRFYFPDEQATSVYLTELTSALQEKFHFEILCGPPGLITEKSGTAPNVKIHRVFSLNLPKQSLLTRFLNDLSFLFSALLRGFFLPRPDLVVSQTSPPGIWWVARLLSLWHRAPWVHICQDLFPDNLKTLYALNGGPVALLEKMNTFILREARRLVVLGRDMEERLLEKGFSQSRLRQIPNWVDLDFIHPRPKRNSFSEKNNLIDKFVVLYAGNFGRVYNFEDVVACAERLRNHPEIIFVFVGEGALKEELIRAFQSRGIKNFLVVPFEPRSRIPEVLASADAGLILLKKGMSGLSVPSKIYSMLASGRPVVACVEEKSEIAKIVRESNSGFVVPPGNPEGLAGAIQKLFEDPSLKERLGENARRFAEEKDFQSSAFRKYEDLFLEALKNEKAV